MLTEYDPIEIKVTTLTTKTTQSRVACMEFRPDWFDASAGHIRVLALKSRHQKVCNVGKSRWS
jgi:hypothetical protein